MGNYIGLDPVYGQFLKQTLIADDISTSFTLDYPTSQDESLVVSYGGVIQEPGVSYTVDGTNIDFTFTPSSAVSPFYIVYMGENMLIPVLSIGGMVTDTLPKLGGNLDLNNFSLSDGTNTVLDFTQNTDAENYLVIENASMGNAPQLRVDGAWSDVDLNITAKGAGIVRIQPELHVGAASTIITEDSITTTNFTSTGNFASTGIDDNASANILTITDSGSTFSGTLQSGDLTVTDNNPLVKLKDADNSGSAVANIWGIDSLDANIWSLGAIGTDLNIQSHLGDIILKNNAGGAALTVDGATSNVNIAGTGTYFGPSTAGGAAVLARPIDTGYLQINGGINGPLSAGMNLYGGNHATAKSRMDFYQNNVIRMRIGEATAGSNIELRDAAGVVALKVDGTTGAHTNAQQPAFHAHNSATRSNVTGNATPWTVIFDTERFDQGGDYSTASYTFTAPVAGRYLFQTAIRTSGIDTSADTFTLNIVTSNMNYQGYHASTNDIGAPSEYRNQSVICDMDASDTAYVQFIVTGMAGDTVDIYGSAVSAQTIFSGCLLT